VDFTREPIIETVITPKEGCKLVVRSSKTTGQEEYFVDAVEVVSFGHSFFFRSLERPKSFLVPATDYELLEVREARMVLKNVGIDRTIKIAGGREPQQQPRQQREPAHERHVEPSHQPEEATTGAEAADNTAAASGEKTQEGRSDKKRDRRRQHRRRRGREGTNTEEDNGEKASAGASTEAQQGAEGSNSPLAQQVVTTSILTSLLPPPPTLISETIARYKDNALFKDAFYSKEEQQAQTETTSAPTHSQEHEYSHEISEAQEQEIYQERKRHVTEHSHDAQPLHDPFAHDHIEEHHTPHTNTTPAIDHPEHTDP